MWSPRTYNMINFRMELKLKTMESLQSGVQLHSAATLFVSIYLNDSCITNVIAALTLH